MGGVAEGASGAEVGSIIVTPYALDRLAPAATAIAERTYVVPYTADYFFYKAAHGSAHDDEDLGPGSSHRRSEIHTACRRSRPM